MAMNGHSGPPGTGGSPGNDPARSQDCPRDPDHAGDDDLLPCGRSLDDVWADHEGAPGEAPEGHPVDCVHCTAALADLRTLDDLVQRTRAEDENTPAPDASALASRVMDLVRLELRPGRSLPLGEAEEDHWIVETAAARALRDAAETVAGVRAGSCRVAPAAGSGVRAPVRVTIEVEAGARRALPELAEAVRSAVAGAADRAIGMRVSEVDVVVVDLFDETGEDPR
ncbi:hypothetical protein GCM10010329_62160 [Streptomyces spiroverticillatus]|uniref:Asp23/Gls24 family envelope stress response protein n=1 Tax=Streptomyces finlayi TaxID=67296 RepID=A0A918X603_9ACTN|nr:hypothetical protein [Streptomyces finlayi]GHA30453.1 hypothetical protein GCM10010329_62160 [Streptomyces spiroverticillatus]GHD14819.1 hypothetical protein GCM10010334_74270 [Streptomyces finlayi]